MSQKLSRFTIIFLVAVLVCAGVVMLLPTCKTAAFQTTQYRVRSTGDVIKSNNTLRNTNPDYVNKYRRIETYIPGENTPVKTVQLCFNVFTGPGSLQESEESRKILRGMLDIVNTWYANNSQPSDPIPGVAFLPDTKIRFEVGDRIFFYNDEKLFGSCNVYEMEKAVKAADSTRMDYLNIYFTFGGCTQHAIPPWPGFDYYPTATGMNGNQHVLMPVTTLPSYASAQTLAHELGHCVDLMHMYKGSCCHETCDITSPEYLDDVFGKEGKKNCWQEGGWHCDPTDTNNTCTNNMMSGTALVGYYFSPKQMGKMHRALSIKTTKRYVKESDPAPEPRFISNDELWNFEIRLYSDIVIRKGATLTLTSNLYMPGGSKIIIRRGGKLISEEGKIISTDPSESVEIVRK